MLNRRTLWSNICKKLEISTVYICTTSTSMLLMMGTSCSIIKSLFYIVMSWSTMTFVSQYLFRIIERALSDVKNLKSKTKTTPSVVYFPYRRNRKNSVTQLAKTHLSSSTFLFVVSWVGIRHLSVTLHPGVLAGSQGTWSTSFGEEH